MLKTLILKNLILVEEASISFQNGLTVITGETGSGKTALIEAIRLILGERADISKLRKGADKAIIQGAFDLTVSPQLETLLAEVGISYSHDEELVLSREINASGKGRAFVAGQLVPIAFLQKLGVYLVDFIGQHAPISLKSAETQREFLDLYGEVDSTGFQSLWESEIQLESKLKKLKEEKVTSEKREEQLAQQLKELDGANMDQDDALFEEYTLLANSQELLATSSEVLNKAEIATSKTAEISPLLEKITKYDQSLQEALKMGKEAHLQLSELHSLLQSFQAKIENDPNRLLFLEERLKFLERLKKMHGDDLPAARKSIKEELEKIGSLDHLIETLFVELKQARKETTAMVESLRNKRQRAASKLEKLLSSSLQELNIPFAQVTVKVEPTNRTRTGEDAISFYLQANRGERPMPVKESSSGGELSRLLFALKSVLAKKNRPQTMIFDEIDANVGGKTATGVGKKLKELGLFRQVICITHFPQVASQGEHHLRVSKDERGNRTICRIDSLDPKAKEAELLRMLGGEGSLTDFYSDTYQN